jgi:mannose-1-phosphate guanylyltransferase/mannose-6-phosphate isomerase
MTEPRVIPVILCGGAGTRLWPSSRETHPKQFLPLVGERSTFELTLERVSDDALFAAPLVVTADAFRFLVADQMQRMGARGEIVLEPMRRDSGAAIAVAAGFVAARQPDALMLVLAADHLVRDVAAFSKSVRDGMAAAASGAIVTFGITPTKPATGYGYIAPGKPIDKAVRKVERFIEKPERAMAVKLIAEGNLWNSGNFLMRADVFLAELARFEPEMHRAALESVAKAKRDQVDDVGFVRLDKDAFASSPTKSVDYAVMERTERSALVTAAYDWSDLGSWNAIWEASDKDEAGNARLGSVETVGARDSFVLSEDGITTALVGLDNVTVVATRDAVLVANREVNSEMKTLVARLGKSNRRITEEHKRVYRPWGWYQQADLGERHQVKRIQVKPGARLSLQKHFHRSEHWVVVKGTATVTVGKKVTIVHENESIYIPGGAWHRMANEGKIPLEIVEVQTGSYLGEDDIVRSQDDYARA